MRKKKIFFHKIKFLFFHEEIVVKKHTSMFASVVIATLLFSLPVSSAFARPDVQTVIEKTVNFESQSTIDFLSLYEGRSVTFQFLSSAGIIFRASPVTILPNNLNVFPSGVAVYNGDTPANEVVSGKIQNPWVVTFPNKKVLSVRVSLVDKEDNTATGPVIHHMYVFDQTGLIIHDAGWFDNGLIPFPLDFSFDIAFYARTHPGATIAKVLFDSNPFGAMEVSKIMYRYSP